MPANNWEVLLSSLYDLSADSGEFLPGVCLVEWVTLMHHDYDAVDRLYLDHETQGGD